MKKLMIATAAAALAGAGFADGVVYDMLLSVKTTKATNGTVKDACGCYDGSVYRKQASYKIQGLFWGCDCYLPTAVLVDRDPFTGVFEGGEGNYIFWNVTDKGVWIDDDGKYVEQAFAWDLLGRIGNKATDCEGAWTLTIGDLELKGAGFGKVQGCTDATIVKSINGNFAGFWNPGKGCLRCAGNEVGYWPLCECEEDQGLTAAYGTWTLKYNSSASKKFTKGNAEWYKFPAYVLPAIAQFIDGAEPTPDDPAAKAKKAWEDAKAELADAEKLAEELKTADTEANLKKGVGTAKGLELYAANEAAKKDADAKKTAMDDAKKDCSGNLVTDAVDAYEAAIEATKKALKEYNDVLAKKDPAATEAEIKAAKDKWAKAETDEVKAKETYDKAVAGFGTQDKADAAAYLAASGAKFDADQVAKEAKNDYDAWFVDGQKKAKDEADKAVTDAKTKVNQAQLVCLAAGGDCI